jgi:hypothetical protein
MQKIGFLRGAAVSLAAGLVLAACAYPVSEVVQGGTSSAIYFEAFPADAAVMVDGQSVGTVGDFDGADQTLAVAPGTHLVQVIHGGSVLHDRKVFVGRDSALKITR